jgi:FMN phosphatase YigB (HAD superfamily)
LRLFLRAAGLTSAQIDEVEAAGHGRYRAYEMELLPLPGVGTVLSRLNELGIPLTMLSTSYLDTDEVRRRLETLGIDSHFQNILAVPDLWRSHPDRSPFEVASELTELAARRTGFVGRDSAALAEAGLVGMRRIAVNCDDDALADVFLRSFDRLPDSVPWDVPVSQGE